MVINTNMAAQTSARLLAESSSLLAKSLARLSSGSKIVSPEDDAAGLAVSMRFDAQISRINAARSNLGNAVSFHQTQDGYLNKVGQALDRMSELAILAQDATKSNPDRELYNAEFVKLGAYIDDLGSKEFNGISLFDGGTLDITTDGEGNTTAFTNADLTDAVYGDATGATVDTATNAADALTKIKLAIEQVAEERANIGASMSALNSYSAQLGLLQENLSAANSRIKDVDVAEESANFARYNILVQAGTAMLAQANQTPQSVLRLIQ